VITDILNVESLLYNGSMSTPILATKLYIPRARSDLVPRPRLIRRLNENVHAKLTLISAPAGFGKTTLVSAWVASCGRPTAWLSLDEADNDPIRFMLYFIAALQTIVPDIGAGVVGVLHALQPQKPPPESTLTTLLNEISTISNNFILVLDDYHLSDSKAIGSILSFLLKHLPPQMHLIITTREDPNLPIAQLRARGQLTELRVADLRFTASEAGAFINQVMGLKLSAEDIAALEARTEGWIAGLQLAAISMQGHHDVTSFIKSFTGTHHFVLDYLLEEVLRHQSERVQKFLLRTSILDRMCGPLCDAVLLDSPGSGQATLEYLERANMFIIPLDNERRWFRYHHLFADLLRQRLQESGTSTIAEAAGNVAELHSRASVWYENNGLEIEAFHHATAANDVERAERIIEGEGVPLHFRGAGAPVLKWLKSLPTTVLNARPSLWLTYASALMMTGQHTTVEQTLQAAESSLAAQQGIESDSKAQDLVGRIASMRATLAIIEHDADTIIAQSRRALEYLRPDNLPIRTATTYTLGYAYQLQGNRAAARQAYTEVISISKSFGESVYTTAATLGLGQVQEAENQLPTAEETYQRVLQLAGDPPRPIACEAHLGLARIYYQWNELDTAEVHGRECLQLTRQMESVDTTASCQVVLARLKLAQSDSAGATAILAEAETFVRQHNFAHQMTAIAATQVLTLLQQDNLAAAAVLAQTHEVPISRARVYLAQGETTTALAILEPLHQQVEAQGWQDERLRVMVLQVVALAAHGETEKAVGLLSEALELAEPGGFIRIFVDEGLPMAQLLSKAAAREINPDYISKLLSVLEAERQADKREYPPITPASSQSLIEPLSERELEVLRLLRTELSGPEIAGQLVVSLSTMRTHTQNIYNKLGVNNRRAAVRRAAELNLL
jgi:ATP/maltotriose-dependent transcriptional regulator MalT